MKNGNYILFLSFPSLKSSASCYLRVILIFIFSFIGNQQVAAQSLPVNIGFESGSFSGWIGATGQCCPIYAPNPGIDTARHVIVSGNFTDPHTNGLLPVVAPTSTFSARLGNENNSAESEILEYVFVVPSDSLFLKIHFAVLLENGLHPSVKQPRFTYHVNSNNSIPEGCSSIEIIAGEIDPDTIINGNLEVYFWQSRIVNLIGRGGETVNVRFETGDCGPGGHFGYAYIDCELVNASIGISACNNYGQMTLVAPPGLDGNWQNGSNDDTLIVDNPSGIMEYFLQVNSQTDCNFKLPVNVNHLLPVADFNSQIGCERLVTFNNYSQADTGSSYNWTFGDGANSSDLIPQHQYPGSGEYTAILTVVQPNNCRQSDTALVNINTDNEITIAGNGHCTDEVILFTPEIDSISTAINQYSWYINHIFQSNSNSASAIFGENGIYPIMLITEDIEGCFDTTFSNIEILNDTSCVTENYLPYIPSAFTPNGDGINDIFEIKGSEYLKNIKLSIVNRFGEIICNDISWNGNEGETTSPVGIYVYIITFNFKNKSHTLNGTIALIR